MPKERLHILLAQESARLVAELGCHRSPAGQTHLLAAILPDMFFYDLPTFKLGSYGRALHRFEGRAAVDFCRDWLRQDGDQMEQAHKQWMFGFAGHFLADGWLHPLINGNCRRFGKDFKLTFNSCHHWLESELESYWLAAIGPVDGFLRLLDGFIKQPEWARELVGFLRAFLSRAGLTPMPPEDAMRNCLRRQVRLLQLFADPRWTAVRPWLIRFRLTQSFGVLLAPPLPALPLPAAEEAECFTTRSQSPNPRSPLNPLPQGTPPSSSRGETPLPPEMAVMFKPGFMARTILHLSSHLLELAKLF